MALYHRIPAKYLRLMPATYFMLLGVISLLADVISGRGASTLQVVFMLFLSVPLLFRNVWIYLVFGTFYLLILSLVFTVGTMSLIMHVSVKGSLPLPLLSCILGYCIVLGSMALGAMLIRQCLDLSGHTVFLRQKLP
jgi:hypothetical protein